MGFFDDVGDAINNTGKSISDAFDGFARGLNSFGASSSRDFNSLRQEFERGDIGKGVSVVFRPFTSVVEGFGDIGKGLVNGNVQEGFETGGKRMIGGYIQGSNPIISGVQATNAGEQLASENEVTNIWVQGGKSANTLQEGKDLSSEQVSDLTQMYVAQAAIAGAYVAAPAVSAWATANPVTAGMVAAQVIKDSETGNYGRSIASIGNQIAPGLGNAIAPVIAPQPAANRPNPLDSGNGNAYSNYTVPAMDKTTLFALIGAGLVLIL